MKRSRIISLFIIAFVLTIGLVLFFPTKADAASKFPVYRLYNVRTHEHLFTRLLAENNGLNPANWRQEGVAWHSSGSGENVYRLLNNKTKDHHYTKDKKEINVLATKYNWKVEGTVFYSGGSIPVYRLYNKNFKMGAHHFTTDKNEYNNLPKYGWRQEGIAFYTTAKGASNLYDGTKCQFKFPPKWVGNVWITESSDGRNLAIDYVNNRGYVAGMYYIDMNYMDPDEYYNYTMTLKERYDGYYAHLSHTTGIDIPNPAEQKTFNMLYSQDLDIMSETFKFK